MSYYDGCSSYVVSYSSSSNSDDDSTSPNYVTNMKARLEEMDEEEALLLRLQANNNLIIAQYLNDENNQPRHSGGSISGHVVINRDRESAQRNLWNDYFSENPRYNDKLFRRRFRMGQNLFLRIVSAVQNHDNYFVQRRNALGRLGLTSLQKITAVFRMLAYGAPADSTNEYVKIGESTTIESMKRFCRAVVEVFGEEYLRAPTANDVARLLEIGEKRGFPGMLGSLDCMHWAWKNCPSGWAGHYTGRSGSPSIILEAVADYDLWIWHAYFGLPGSNNYINVLEASHLFANIAEGKTPLVHYVIGGKEYNVGYYLTDGIYPKWSTLVQTIHHPQGRKKKLFAMKQEACRKDVERAFGVLQSRFAIIKGPTRFWDKRELYDIVTACVIMHNMIIEDERDMQVNINDFTPTPTPDVEMIADETTQFQAFLARHKKIRDEEAHIKLRNALIEHLWDQYGNSVG